MQVWVVIRDYGSHEGYSVPSHIFSNKEAAKEWMQQPDNRGDYELHEYEILDHCPPPRIAQTYEDQNFGLFTPQEKINIGPLSLYPRFYMTDLLEGMDKAKAPVDTFSWNIRKKTRWERFKIILKKQLENEKQAFRDLPRNLGFTRVNNTVE